MNKVCVRVSVYIIITPTFLTLCARQSRPFESTYFITLTARHQTNWISSNSPSAKCFGRLDFKFHDLMIFSRFNHMNVATTMYVMERRNANVDTPFSVGFGMSSFVCVLARLCPVTIEIRIISDAKQAEAPTNTPNVNCERNLENKIADPVMENRTDAATRTNKATRTAPFVSFSVSNEHANPIKSTKSN